VVCNISCLQSLDLELMEGLVWADFVSLRNHLKVAAPEWQRAVDTVLSYITQ